MTWKKFSEEKPSEKVIVIIRRKLKFENNLYVGEVVQKDEDLYLACDAFRGGSFVIALNANDEWQEVQE